MADKKIPKSLTDPTRYPSSFTEAEIKRRRQDPKKILLLIEDGLIDDP